MREGLLHLFLELNFNPRIMDFQKFYDSLKNNDFFPSLSILFLKIGGPFLTFEKFKAFFENLYLQGFLNFDMEEYDGKVEVRFLTLSKLTIGELVSQIKIVSSISLIQVFSQNVSDTLEEEGPDTLEEEGPVQPVELFERLKRLFSELKCFPIELITDLKFLMPLYDVSQTSPEQKKQVFALLVRFCFIINNGIATPHPYFRVHVEHFVVAFMKIIGSSLEGVHVQGTIKSGPTWVHKDGKKRIVCSSFATKKNCCKKTCKFLHPTNLAEYGIITFADGDLMVVCTPCTDIKCSFNRDMNKKYTCECGFAFSCKCKSASECICDCCMKPNCAKSDYIPLCPFAHFDKTIDDFVYREQVVDGGCCAELQPRNGK